MSKFLVFKFLALASLALLTQVLAGAEASIVGHWKFEHEEDGLKISTVTSYLPGGVYTDEGKVLFAAGADRKEIPLSLTGTWKLEKGFLVIEISDSSAPAIYPKGMVFRSKIVAVTQEVMTFISETDKKQYSAKRLATNPNNPAPEKKVPQAAPPGGRPHRN